MKSEPGPVEEVPGDDRHDYYYDLKGVDLCEEGPENRDLRDAGYREAVGYAEIELV